MADVPYAFGKKAAERIKDAVIRIERMTYPSTAPGSKYPIISGSPAQIVDGIVTNSISPYNTNSGIYGSGSVQVVVPTLNTNTNSTYHPVNSGSPVTCINWSVNSGTINTNTHVFMIQTQAGNGSLVYQLNWTDC